MHCLVLFVISRKSANELVSFWGSSGRIAIGNTFVLRPSSKTEPAEFVLAFRARHVHAAASLLDVHKAARTGFRILEYPILDFHVFLLDFVPICQQRAGHRVVSH